MASSLSTLEQEIQSQNALFNELRLSGTNPAGLEEVKKKLGELKKSLGQARKAAAAESSAGSGTKDAAGKKKDRILLKTAKGTRDYGPSEMFCREYVERIVKDCFTTFGASCLDTPVFERKEILTGKYGEDAKLIFDLMDQGGEQLSLRYDHTVPLARYLAMMGGTNTQSKLWQIGKVYRRDNPVMSKGRMREFSQADIDISGVWDPMIPDAEIISLICTILSKLDVGEFTIKINHRKILDGIFEVCGVPADKIRTISSAVDKLDKLPWAEVKKEMTEEKGLDSAIADKIGEYVKHKGGPELLEQLLADSALSSNPSAKQGLEDMGLLFTYLSAYGVISKISFDMSLARGLDYYTGVIYEAIVEASAPPGFKANPSVEPSAPPSEPPKKKAPKKVKNEDGEEEEEVDESQVGVGSIAAGGRYDGLVGMFSAAASGSGSGSSTKGSIPCVGISIGLDRIFALVWPKWVEKGKRNKETMVYVMAAGDGLLVERMKLVKELRDAGIKVDFLAKRKPKLPVQFLAGERDEVPFAVILGENEIREGYVMVKQQKWEMVDGKKVKVVAEGDEKGEKVGRKELVEWLRATQIWKDWEEGRL
ncbi:histidyl-tRNA synthetase [Gymnopus androsaceus JB14]|uniref:histidine--tRNA ligase n=1 Tax=Gymnopus androsaceus JB14 TaxID=1447944 RepID=A0A6A4IB32_9AGAR|nr:histidyl-tRNA synthetase [Gymnopus androsaceus JB14]